MENPESVDDEKVSILLPVPAGESDGDPCQATLHSIASQSYPSTLIEICRVQYVDDAPEGRTSALNAARDNASGAYIVQTAPGTTWDPTKIEKQVLRLQEDPTRHATAHEVRVRRPSGRHTTDFSLLRKVGLRVGSLIRPPWESGSLMLRGDRAETLGAYRYLAQASWEHSVRLVWKGTEVDLVSEILGEAESADSERLALESTGIRWRFLSTYIERVRQLESTSPAEQALLSSAIYLWNDDLTRSHEICQGFERTVPDASFIHGIVHRREADYNNARGWFGRAVGMRGGETIRDSVLSLLQRVLQMPDYGTARDTALDLIQHVQKAGTWDPLKLLSLCEAGQWRDDPALRRLLEEVQEAELLAAIEMIGSRSPPDG
jgi:hypothetical protein